MKNALHPGDDIERLYVSSKEWVKGVASNEDYLDAIIQGLSEHTKRSKKD